MEYGLITNHNTSLAPGSTHPFDQVTITSLIQRSRSQTSAWNHGPLISLTRPSANGHGLDSEVLLSRKLLRSETNVLHTHPNGSTINLEHPDLDADDESLHSTTSSVADPSEHESESHARDSDQGRLESTEPDGYSVPPSLTRSTRIRFRSRVRITSGIHRPRHTATNTTSVGGNSQTSTIRSVAGEGNYYFLTPSSSISGSPSSSISAPLRSRTDDEADRPGWGPLGQRVSLLAKKSKTKNQGCHDDQGWGRRVRTKGLPIGVLPGPIHPNETSPLLIHPPRIKRVDRAGEQSQRRKRACCYSGSGTASGKLSSEEVDEVFGKWPNRTLNFQWWKWHAEAFVCCRCLDESDEESY